MGKILAITKSVCPVCMQVVDACRLVGMDGNIYIKKRCPEHGIFKTLIWEGDEASYAAWGAGDKGGAKAGRPLPEAGSKCPQACGLCSEHLNSACCVLLELTNRCNLHCPVCFAGAGEEAGADLSLAEVKAQYALLAERGGDFNIQLSGGEPTLRDDLPDIIRLGREAGFKFFQLNTNGIRLAEEEDYAKILKQSGLSTVFLQFDGFKEATFLNLRGRMFLPTKLQAIANCQKAGLGVVLVPVIVSELNLDEVGDLLTFALKNRPVVRGVHFQPASYFGRYSLTKTAWRMTIPKLLQAMEQQTNLKFKAGDFSGGGAESPYCSFHASYLVDENYNVQVLPQRRNRCTCTTAAETRARVAERWSGPAAGDGAAAGCCSGKLGELEAGCYSGKMGELEAGCCSGKMDELEAGCCSRKMDETALVEAASLDDFLQKVHEKIFTVSGMLFQDAYNLDLERLRRCYVCEADNRRGLVPFCAYNLTDVQGKALYRNNSNLKKEPLGLPLYDALNLKR